MGLNHLMICTYSADDLRPLVLSKRLLRNAAKLKITINNSVHFCGQEKYKVIIKLLPITLLYFFIKTFFLAFFVGLPIQQAAV